MYQFKGELVPSLYTKILDAVLNEGRTISSLNLNLYLSTEYLENKSELYEVNNKYLLAYSDSKLLKKFGFQTDSVMYNNNPSLLLANVLKCINC